MLERDQEIASLQHKLQLAEADLEKAEDKVKELKGQAEEGDAHKATGENLTRKVQLLEEELDKAEKDLKDATEKLRQVDVKAEHFERQLQRAEQERDDWEKKAAVSCEGLARPQLAVQAKAMRRPSRVRNDGGQGVYCVRRAQARLAHAPQWRRCARSMLTTSGRR